MQPDIEAMRDAVNDLRAKSISTNGDGNAPCTINDLKKLRDHIAETLDVIINSLSE